MNDLTKIVVPVMREPFTFPSDKFEFKKNKKHHWLQKALFWALDKLGCRVDEIAYNQIVIDKGSFMERLHKHRMDVWDRCASMDGPSHLLIGAADFEELMGTPDIQCMLEFHVQYEVGYSVRGRYGPESRYKIMGLKVTIVPWMKGMVILP